MFWEDFQTRKKHHFDIIFDRSKKQSYLIDQFAPLIYLKEKFKTFDFLNSKFKPWNIVLTLSIFLLLFGFFGLNHNFVKTANAPTPIGSYIAKATSDADRKQLENELAEIEAQIAKYEKELASTTKEKTTLQAVIDKLKKEASKISLQIKSTKNQITSLATKIQDTTIAIDKTLENITQRKQELTSLIQALYELSTKSQAEIILANNTLSEYFADENSLNLINIKINEKLAELKDLNLKLNDQKVDLGEKKGEAQNMLQIQILQQNSLADTKKQQETLLEVTKNKEANYQQMLSEQRKKAAELRSRIYNLLGVQTKVTFGEALDIAIWVGGRTGVRPAFLLAILTQESNLGSNVGTCNRPTDPPNKSYTVIMNPKDHPAFLDITRELGMNANSTPVSCPMYQSGKQVGWGGAMGPAQFIPRTWTSYKSQISNITGKNPPNPWDIRDAFAAAALYVAANGAKSQTKDGEWRSAMIYFSGSTNTRFRFYGDNVIAIANRYQNDIDAINKAK